MFRFVAFLLACPMLTSIAYAQTTTVEVTIQSVKPEAKEVTVEYQIATGEKSITLDVSRKAEITLNGEASSLELLGAGLTATIEYNREFEIVTKIVATGEATEPPRLIKVSELEGYSPWLSEDGLTVYWEEDQAIWTARRETSDSYFANMKQLFPGRHPTVSGDGLEMIFLAKSGDTFSLHGAARTSLDGSFTRGKEIAELRNQVNSKNPCLASDGLALFFNSSDEVGSRIVVATRSTRTSPWSPPNRLLIEAPGKGRLAWPYFTADGLTMFCSHEGTDVFEVGKPNLMVWSRKTIAEPFSKHRYIEIQGLPVLTGQSPRYVEATGELFFYQKIAENQGRISVIKNFPLTE